MHGRPRGWDNDWNACDHATAGDPGTANRNGSARGMRIHVIECVCVCLSLLELEYRWVVQEITTSHSLSDRANVSLMRFNMRGNSGVQQREDSRL